MSATLLSMIFAHLLCNALAEDQPLPPREAYFCSANFEDLKATLNPNLTLEEFHRLKFEEKAKVSVQSYLYYKAWIAENAHIYADRTAYDRPALDLIAPDRSRTGRYGDGKSRIVTAIGKAREGGGVFLATDECQ